MPNSVGIHERILVEAHVAVERSMYLYIRSHRPNGETLRSYRFKLTEEQAIDLSEDMTEELNKGKPLI